MKFNTLIKTTLLVLASASINAQQGYHADYSKLINSAEVVGPVGDSSFGENVNLYSGKTTFQQTDFAISGNSQLPVSIGRTYNVENRNVTQGKLGAFGDWDLDIPRLEGIFPASLAWNRDDRCTKFDVLDPTALQQSWSDGGLITSNNGWNNVEGIVGYRYEVSTQQPIISPADILSGAAGTVHVIAN